jgi:hypothetical protein
VLLPRTRGAAGLQGARDGEVEAPVDGAGHLGSVEDGEGAGDGFACAEPALDLLVAEGVAVWGCSGVCRSAPGAHPSAPTGCGPGGCAIG